MKNIKLRIVLLIIISLGLLSFKSPSIKCTATWYNRHGQISASGIRINKNKPTAAYNFYPFGTKILVTNIENNKKVVVTVTDRIIESI
jgi:rare lipoprotein A (peptidoglycan hydrolase)